MACSNFVEGLRHLPTSQNFTYNDRPTQVYLFTSTRQQTFEKLFLSTYHSRLTECIGVSQFAYKPNSSTVLALLYMHDDNVRGSLLICLLPAIICYKDSDFRGVIPNFVYFYNWLCDHLSNHVHLDQFCSQFLSLPTCHGVKTCTSLHYLICRAHRMKLTFHVF